MSDREHRHYDSEVVRQLLPDEVTNHLDPREANEAKDVVARWHWYEPEEYEQELKLLEWDDPDFPEGALIACGNLWRLHVRLGDKIAKKKFHPRRDRDHVITLKMRAMRNSYVTFDLNHRFQRIYLLIAPEAMKSIKETLWDRHPGPELSLSYLAAVAGGRHATPDYPDVKAKPLGLLTGILYFTDKKGDGPSPYLHVMGENTCYIPILACDERGRLWVCGGNYTSPYPGIMD